MDYQQAHGYMRPPPPPPPSADPYQRPPPPVPPPPSNNPWSYPAPQFQYHPQTQHSPSPPPPQWPPPSDHAPYPHPPYPGHQAPPYAVNPRYPGPHPFPPRAPHVPRSQDWASGSWNQHHGWQYPTNNEEDWATKARAWAAAKSATENQQGQSQFVQAGRPEEQNHFHDQYAQPIDHQYHDGHAPLAPTSNYQPYPVGHPSRTGQSHFQESQYTSSGQPPYAGDMHMPFAARDGNLSGDSVAPFQQQEKSSISPLTHQQEVPSSYSSVAGKEEAGDRYEKFASAPPVVSVSRNQSLPPAGGRSGWMEETHILPGNLPAEPVTDLSDQPLNFAPHFNRDMNPQAQSIYTHSSIGPVRGGDPSVPVSSNYAWTPSSVPRAVYPSVPPTAPTGPQVDHSIGIPSPASGHSAPMFPAGSGFQPTVPMIGTSFGVAAGISPHSTAFSGDAYGVSERPKKASVPNWLREEIIKNKAVITSSTPGVPKEDTQSIDEDSNDKSYRKGDLTDSKSADSSRSTEDEDEDEVEAARAAAINKEIKRVLTEVLLKVTDKLFDEIATKVLKEDDLSVEGSDNQILSSTPSVLTPKASARVLISTKAKESDYEDASEKSTSGAPDDILGLASYASDEEDEEIQSSSNLNSKESAAVHQQSSAINSFKDNHVNVNSSSQRETEEHVNIPANLETDSIVRNGIGSANPDHGTAETDLNVDRPVKELASSDHNHSPKRPSRIAEERLHHGSDISWLHARSIEDIEGNETPDGNLDTRGLTRVDSRIQNARNISGKNDILENKSSMVKKDSKDSESFKGRSGKKGDEERRHEERHVRTERIDYPDKSNDKVKDEGSINEKGKYIESRKRPSPSTVKDRMEAHRDKRTAVKNDSDDKKPDRVSDEKEERSRHKSGSESSRRKRHHSSDESSDDSKRKSRHSKRHKSPSPVRSRKRQVSRSPHSKHSKRRNSPYSSFETTRRKRSSSRSRSPVHRRR